MSDLVTSLVILSFAITVQSKSDEPICFLTLTVSFSLLQFPEQQQHKELVL